VHYSLLLVSQVTSSSLADDEVLAILHLIDAVVTIRLDEAVRLTVHSLGTQSGCEQENLLVHERLEALREVQKLNLDASILLWTDTLALGAVVVSARLAVELTIDGIALAELDLAIFLEVVELPFDERVIVWVPRRCNERPSPVSHQTEALQCLLT